MITIPGQLAIKTIHGRNGDFNVGRLATSIGEFVVKNAVPDAHLAVRHSQLGARSRHPGSGVAALERLRAQERLHSDHRLPSQLLERLGKARRKAIGLDRTAGHQSAARPRARH